MSSQLVSIQDDSNSEAVYCFVSCIIKFFKPRYEFACVDVNLSV